MIKFILIKLKIIIYMLHKLWGYLPQSFYVNILIKITITAPIAVLCNCLGLPWARYIYIPIGTCISMYIFKSIKGENVSIGRLIYKYISITTICYISGDIISPCILWFISITISNIDLDLDIYRYIIKPIYIQTPTEAKRQTLLQKHPSMNKLWIKDLKKK